MSYSKNRLERPISSQQSHQSDKVQRKPKGKRFDQGSLNKRITETTVKAQTGCTNPPDKIHCRYRGPKSKWESHLYDRRARKKPNKAINQTSFWDMLRKLNNKEQGRLLQC